MCILGSLQGTFHGPGSPRCSDFLAFCLEGSEENRSRLFVCCPLNIYFLWEKRPQWFQPSGLQGSLQTKHISGSFRKNILKVFSPQGNTLNRLLIFSWLFFLALSHLFASNILLSIRLCSLEHRKFPFSISDVGPGLNCSDSLLQCAVTCWSDVRVPFWGAPLI